MEKITDKYYLGSNKNTYILYEKKISQTTGKETFKNLGYYTRLEALYSGLIEKEIRDDLSLIRNINQIIFLINEIKEFTIKYTSKNND